MSRIFLSHSSSDNAAAVALRDWLRREGWDDIFLDLDPDRGIVAGERWERSLNEAAHRCEAVLFLVSRVWLASGWCLKEFNLAHRLNKRMFGVLIEEIPIADLPVNLTSTWQLVRLGSGRDHVMLRVTMPITGEETHVTFSAEGLARLKAGLQRAGLDARFFAWPPQSDPKRPPYRGLKPLEAEDAGIFLGRDAAIIDALDRLRGLREGAPPRFFVILGASGAGKSSFMRAGLLPRLDRDEGHFLPLPVLRPERAAISGDTGLLHALEAAFEARGIACTRPEIRAAIAGGAKDLAPMLGRLVAGAQGHSKTREDSDNKPPTLVLPIDQGEELFVAEGSSEAEQLLALLHDLVTTEQPSLLVLVTMRSDAYERLQIAKALDGIRQETMSLPPMPRGSYQAVIEGPARRLQDTPRALRIDPKLTHALLADIESGGGRDALPLLAFTLERLYLEYGRGGQLMLADYEALGRIKGSIEAAVEQALTATEIDAHVPRDREARLALLRRGLIPWLAAIDSDTGSPRRRVARISEIPAETRPLIHQLVEQRLLATDVSQDTGESTIEPAHEALLRQWSLLQAWLSEDFGALTTLDGVKRAARDWAANNRDAAWLTHTAARLQEAERLRMRDDLVRHIEPVEQDYLSQCRQREDAERQAERLRLARERRSLQHVRWALLAFSVAVMAALGGALWQSYQTSKREAAVFANEADDAFQAGLCDRALRLTLAGLPPARGAWPLTFRSTELENAFARYASAHECPFQLALAGHGDAVLRAAFSPDGARAVTVSADKTARLWDVKTGATLATLTGHAGPVNAAAFSPDGTRVVTASDDHTARVWDARTGAMLATLAGHVGPVNSAVFSRDGGRIATAADDRTARVWDAATGAALATLSGHGRRVRTVAFSPDGGRLVTASNDQTARLWDARTGAPLATLAGHKDWVRAAAFSPDGSRIVTACEDKTARLWDGKTGESLLTLSGHTGYVVGAEFSPDGGRVVTASFDKTARLWDAATGALLATLAGHAGRINGAAFSPDGRRVATGSEDKSARLWDAATGAPLAIFSGHEDAIRSAVFHPDGSSVLTASFDATARLWDAASGVALLTLAGHDGHVQSAAFGADGRRVATASDDMTARLWDGKTGAELATLAGHKDWVRTAAFSADGRRVVTASFDHTARLWDGKTGELVAILAHEGLVRGAFFSPDGSRILTVSNDNTAGLWDGKTGARVAALVGHADRVYGGAFSPDGSRIATAAYDSARLWHGKTGAPLATLAGHTDRANNVAFSPDGNRVVTTSEDKTARLWDGKTGAAMATLARHGDATYSATFSPDGSRLVTASFDNTARVWDGKSGTLLMTLAGHGGPVNSAAFSPDGSRIVTASFDNTARVWDASTGAVLVTLAGHGGPVNSALFSPDGGRIVTASDDKTARLWDAAPARTARRDVIDRMPLGERRDYVCRELLVGARLFTEAEMRDSLLLGRDDLRNPCDRVGPLSIEYYWRALAELWR